MNLKNNVVSSLCAGILVGLLSACGSETEPKEELTNLIPDEKPVETPTDEVSIETPPDEVPVETPPDEVPVETPPDEVPVETPPDEVPVETPPEEIAVVIIPDTPIIAVPLASFTIEANRNDSEINVTWTDANAVNYRVLFWDETGKLYEWNTVQHTQVIPSPVSTHAGQYIVEAYDALGNSIFSEPASMEAL